MLPTEEQAIQFAVMLQAGLPAADAIAYFTDSADPLELAHMLEAWRRSRAVKRAMLSLMGKPWQGMSLDERIRYALDIHYAQLAYLLYSSNYAEVGSNDKSKLDTARVALEQKLAGLAGKGDALSEFFADLKSGKVKLNPVPVPLPKLD